MSKDDYDYIRSLIHKKAAIVLDESKGYLIDSRLGQVQRQRDMNSLGSLVHELRTTDRSSLVQDVVHAMTTNETSFFRDPAYFDALRSDVLPGLLARRSGTKQLRVWCAAASSGQEPYSLAILLSELSTLHDWKVEIIATDLDEEVLLKAREGLYSGHEVMRGLSDQLRERYFESEGRKWRVKKRIRDMVKFQTLNLAGQWPQMAPFDLILVRNVLIYFDTPTKKRVLERARGVLKRDGFLVLGGSESTLNVTDVFERLRIGRANFYQPK